MPSTRTCPHQRHLLLDFFRSRDVYRDTLRRPSAGTCRSGRADRSNTRHKRPVRVRVKPRPERHGHHPHSGSSRPGCHRPGRTPRACRRAGHSPGRPRAGRAAGRARDRRAGRGRLPRRRGRCRLRYRSRPRAARGVVSTQVHQTDQGTLVRARNSTQPVTHAAPACPPARSQRTDCPHRRSRPAQRGCPAPAACSSCAEYGLSSIGASSPTTTVPPRCARWRPNA